MEEEVGCQGNSLLHNSVNLIKEEMGLDNVSVRKTGE